MYVYELHWSLNNIYICDRVCKNRSYLHKYTYSFYHIYLFFCVGYTISVSFIEFLRKFCVHDEKFLIKYYVRKKKLLNLKDSKLGQILRADKTGFCRLGHIYICCAVYGEIPIMIHNVFL